MEITKEASGILRQAGVSEARREAGSLVALTLQKDISFLVAHPEYMLSEDEEKRFNEYLNRRVDREPLQYIRGHQEFFKLDFIVTPDVLIPRPETELLVENALSALQNFDSPIICEVGVGSGCIAISILHENTTATGIGLDVSEAALAVARTNAENNGVAGRLELRQSDVFEALGNESFEVIISNPPYVPAKDFISLQEEVRDFEPRQALTDNGDGLSIISQIVAGSPKFLRPGGFLFLEVGFNQAHQVVQMFDMNIWKTIETLPDLQGIPRMVKARTG